LSHDGRGVARVDNKVVFVDGALPGERIQFRITGKRRSYSFGTLLEVVRYSDQRVDPPCDHFGVCGGCALQHLQHEAQLQTKHRQLQDNLQRIAKITPAEWLTPLHGPAWGYRRKARLSVRYVEKKGGVLVGFHERHKSYVTPLKECLTLVPGIARLLPSLPALIGSLSCYTRVPQIEAGAGDDEVVLVFRHLEPFTDADRQILQEYALAHEVVILLQDKGPDSIRPLYPEQFQLLSYRLPQHQVQVWFGPTDFVQVNGETNALLIDKAIELLEPGPNDRVLDLFCGVGNFTLPLARYCGVITGVEGDQQLVRRAEYNAQQNDLQNAEFECANLFVDPASNPALSGAWIQQKVDKLLLDPPRTGAIDVIKQISRLAPGRIVYVSCNPATLARDGELLVHKLGYRLLKAGIVDMFPHTAHIESIALFERP